MHDLKAAIEAVALTHLCSRLCLLALSSLSPQDQRHRPSQRRHHAQERAPLQLAAATGLRCILVSAEKRRRACTLRCRDAAVRRASLTARVTAQCALLLTCVARASAHSLHLVFSLCLSAVVRALCRWWCEICDPVLCYNPLWIKYLSMLSPFVFLPFYFVSMYAIVARKEWIRIPIIIYSSILFVDLSAFFVEGIWGDLPSPSMAIFTAGYGQPSPPDPAPQLSLAPPLIDCCCELSPHVN